MRPSQILVTLNHLPKAVQADLRRALRREALVVKVEAVDQPTTPRQTAILLTTWGPHRVLPLVAIQARTTLETRSKAKVKVRAKATR